MTLIEVLAALMLLGSLAVAMLLSRDRLIDQHARAQQKSEAVRAADVLLESWWSGDRSTIPVDQDGPVEGHANWSWQLQTVKHNGLGAYRAQVVRLRILDKTVTGMPVELTSVDLVLPEGGGP